MASAFGDGLETQIAIFETDMGGPVEADFEEDGVLGPDPDGLIFEELEELFAEAEGEIVGEDALDAQGEDPVQLLSG